MAVTIKSKKEIELMREAGKMLEEVHNKLADFVKPGISTLEIDQFGEKAIRDLGCVPNFLNYNGYPASICVSVNDEVVHGIPSKDRILQDGDIVSLDAGLIHEGYHSDAARTHAVGNISEEAKRLIEVTKQSFFEGIKLAVPGNHLFDISEAIQKYVESNGYSVVRDLVGHGIGTHLRRGGKAAEMRKGAFLCRKICTPLPGTAPAMKNFLYEYKPETKTPRSGLSHRTRGTSPDWRGRTHRGVRWRI